MENLNFVIGVILLFINGVLFIFYWEIERQILEKEIDPIGLKGLPIAITLIILPLLSTYLIFGIKNWVIFGIYFFAYLLITMGLSFLAHNAFCFLKKPVIISRPERTGVGKAKTYIVIQWILIGVLSLLILMSIKMVYKSWN